MRPIKNYKDIQASGNFERLPAGGYVAKITGVEDRSRDEYLLLTYDIAEGEHKDHFKDTDEKLVSIHQFIRSYKESALGMFKAFTMAVDESNGTKLTEQVEDGLQEQQLVGKLVGILLGEEEYMSNRGELRTGLKVRACMSADRIRKGGFKVPELKKLPQSQAQPAIPAGFTEIKDDDLPF
jgi:hypothetical protein